MRTERGEVIGITDEEQGGGVLEVRSTTSDKVYDFKDKPRDGSIKGHPLGAVSSKNCPSRQNNLLAAGCLLFALPLWAADSGTPLTTGRTHTVLLRNPTRPSRGSAAAPVEVTVFANFSSPSSAAAAELARRSLSERPDQVRLVFRTLAPATSDNARLAAEIAHEAFAQGQFWVFSEAVFARREDLRPSDLYLIADRSGLDMSRLRRVLELSVHRRELREDSRHAQQCGISKGPALCVAGHRLEGNAPYDRLATAIDQAAGRAFVATSMKADDPPPVAATSPVRRVALTLVGAPTRGPLDAPVVLVEFGDLADPSHKTIASAISQLFENYPGRIRHSFRHFPSTKSALLHSMAVQAAEQGHFWDVYDRLAAVSEAAAMTRTSAERIAGVLAREFGFEFSALGQSEQRIVNRDATQARALGLQKPAIFLNGLRLDAPPNYESMQTATEEELRGGLLQRLTP